MLDPLIELNDYCLKVYPYDIDGTADAIYQAIIMDKKERIKKYKWFEEGHRE